MHDNDPPLARATYDQLADAFARHAEDGPYNAHYDRPALLGLLPPVAGLHVLDAGCGPGLYAAWLVAQGATVVGLDVSPRMVALAQTRLGGRATILEADLAQPLTMLADASFDLVISALALDYVPDWAHLFHELTRVLRPGGILAFSVVHPADDFYRLHPEGCYFNIEPVTVTFTFPEDGVKVAVPHYRRPLQAMLTPLLAAGFVLDQLLEPRPTEAFAARDPAKYAVLLRRPAFICVRARRG
ncbi:class I SAM-dependent methyltransferase [Candidatus Chloroploca sp. Khr17]|uniref:class I SAM-dependent methyltransferase n=1 Tax=Candidatus Chloroploca sp. Khr17 TaxID=2496869 RepID=UPI00101CF94C|nr:class I SAM-dependent methyltransferase [Candidatus Chloroploca sp. Khr17]